MIDLVTEILDSRGLVPADRLDGCNIYIGKNLVFHVYDKGGDFVVVKIRDTAEIEAEFAAMQLAHEVMPAHVPRPLALHRARDRHLLVIEGVAHEALASQAIERHGAALAEAMRRFIDGARARFVAPGDSAPHSATLARLIDDLDGPEAGVLRRVVAGLDLDALDRLPHVSQHGDLVMNNFGRAQRGMIIFDWEDFGRVTLPGFDVALLICSCLRHDMVRIRHLFETGEPRHMGEILAHFCAGEIDRDLFRRLLPVYYGTFQDLKRSMGYGAEIIEKCRRNILDGAGSA
jgi:hypothetical protein